MPAVTAAIQSLHSYSVPEVLAMDVTGGSDAYLDWVRRSTLRAGPLLARDTDSADSGAIISDPTTGDVIRTESADKCAAESLQYIAVGTSDACSV